MKLNPGISRILAQRRKLGFEEELVHGAAMADDFADLPEVIYDRDALLQVLFNLIDNALKYSKSAQTREILLRARQTDDVVEISVSDQGPGVSEAHLKHVFEPFYRAEAELTRGSQGTGIGLALVRGLIESMGGSVRGENGADGGFVVRLTLPLAASASA